MKNFKHILFGILTLALTACTDTMPIPDSPTTPSEENSDMVMFSAGGEQVATTRGTVNYMSNNIRFIVSMLHTEGEDLSFDSPEYAYLLVSDQNNLGNSLYYKSNYEKQTDESKIDKYGNDDEAQIFYWKNRKKHAFIGYINDYNAALRTATNTKKDGEADYIPEDFTPNGELCFYDDPEDEEDEPQLISKLSYKGLSLVNTKTGDIYRWNSMDDQPDPLIASTEAIPSGATAETNRVYLTFHHQLAQVQVNLKNHESVSLDADQIDGVELLGVSDSVKLFPYIHHDETGIIYYDQSLIRPAEAKLVDLRDYTVAHKEQNPYGTSFTMFQSDNTTFNYLKTFECITFGKLAAIRIHWHEREDEGGTEHHVTFKVTDNKFTTLNSGKRYIFNLELRRGTLAVVQTVIDDWLPLKINYSGNGTIVK